jgi:hypothetical protein
MVKRRKKPFNLEKMPTCKSFFQTAEIDYVGNDLFSRNVSLWNKSGFTNRQKMFFYKFYNNTLGINVRTSHFVANGTRDCFFCSKRRPVERNDETFVHLFFNCPTVSEWHADFILKCFPEMPRMDDRTKKIFWLLGYTEANYSILVMTAVLSFQFHIWEAKLKKKVPSFHTLYTDFIDSFCQSYKYNSDIRKSCLKLNYSLCRSLLGVRRAVDDGVE